MPIMNTKPDVEAVFELNGTRETPASDGYRPAHLVKLDYLTTGVRLSRLPFFLLP